MKMFDETPVLPEFKKLQERQWRSEGTPETPLAGKCNIIIADVGASFPTWSKKGEGRTPQAKYRTDPFLHYAEFPVAPLAAKASYLIQWVFDTRWLDSAGNCPYDLLAKAWGFPYYLGKFASYVKLVKDQSRTRMGLGFNTRKVTEQCYIWGRGGPSLPRADKGVSEVIVDDHVWDLEEFAIPVPRVPGHSGKPIEFRQLIERLWGPDITVFEMFARDATVWPDREPEANWYFWGNECEADPSRIVDFEPYRALEIKQESVDVKALQEERQDSQAVEAREAAV